MAPDQARTNNKDIARVSVIVPVFNHESFVEEAVLSALSQSHPIFELIAIDDGSTDGSLERLRLLEQKDRRVRIHSQTNRGASATINRGLMMAAGDWIAVLNSDDRWLPERLARLLEIAMLKDAKVVFSRSLAIDEMGEPLDQHHSWCVMYETLMHHLTSAGLSQALCRGNPVISSSNFFFHRSALKRVGMLRHRRFVADWDWALRAVLQDSLQCQWCHEPLLEYRVHSTNTIRKSGLRSSIEIARMLSGMQITFPAYALALSPALLAFQRDIRQHVARDAYAKGQNQSDARHLQERSQSEAVRFALETERDQARSALDALQTEHDRARMAYTAEIARLEEVLVQERSQSEAVRFALETERDQARADQRASHEAHEHAVEQLEAATLALKLERESRLGHRLRKLWIR
ncbi:MAG: glycosyltransferase [Betaproteobacteria bacterium]|nr:glycosyltransferase [Betaproteobacteria bacterium]NDD11158.1 glycosyltransferase [Betaproteobacteria bacterium]